MGDEEGQSGIATGGDYDVFLSFRGPDTRHGFTDCLYVFMCEKEIRVFRDDEELRPGEKISEILRAIERSMLYIPIFSKNYASSKWCLKELACMMDCVGQSKGKKILPVFYDVDPSDVKLKTELYRSALRKHEDEGCTEVKSWEEALTTVAKIRGWHLKDKGQGAVIKEIIEKVLLKITTTKRNLPTVLVGMDDRIEALKKLLYCDFSDVRFVIIHGIGGIGKTTLAKTVFNQLSPQFESHSFLSRESSPGGGVRAMQKKLIWDLFGFSLPDTLDFEEGNNMIRQRLYNERVLLVFDGLDENDQFMQLAKQCTLCGPGSRIIVTTRDKSVFPVTKVEGLEENISTQLKNVFLYEMKEMDFDHALQLFNKLAFNTDVAPRDLYDLSREVVELTGGLPLAVEVIGSDLRDKSRAKWIRTLKRLKEVPPEEVQQRLKISYDGLPYRAKQIYLDIACFFANKKKTNLIYMWDDSGFFPEDEIEVLLNKSLIKIVDHDRIWMHDLLRALGWEIIREENMRRPEDGSRLWFLEKAHEMSRNTRCHIFHQGTERAVALRPRGSEHNFTCKDFAKLTNARFLKLDGGNLAGDFEDDLEVRYLWWRNCPPQLQAKNFVLNRLVVLKLSGDITAEEWSGWTEIMVASRLKVLKIEGSKSLKKTPCFSKFTSLERLVLEDFINLVEIDCSIGMLEQLIYLKIKCCPCLRGLPEDIGDLTALRELILIQCFSVCYLPDSIGNLSLLSRLLMEDTGLVKLPNTIEGLAKLEYLSLVNCTSVKSLPDAVGELKMLTELDLSGTTVEELPRSIWNRSDLRLRINSSEISKKLMVEFRRLEGIENYCNHPFYYNGDMRTEVDSKFTPKTVGQWLTYKAWPRLMNSYEALEYGAKQIFLDIACFFVDKKIASAMCVWEACDFLPNVELCSLLRKHFIDVSNTSDRVRMSPEVIYFAHEIFHREITRQPQDRSRSWSPEMALDREGIEIVRALAFGKLRRNYELKHKYYAYLRNMRFLVLDGHNFAGDFKIELPELRWLCWRNCPPKLQLNNFVLSNIVVLKLSGDIIAEEWSGWTEIMVASRLKVLKIEGSKSLIKTPCFSKFTSLERLVLKDLINLAEIDCPIGMLERLICLKIKCCPCLRGLPEDIGHLTALRELILIQCFNVRYLPASIGNLSLLSRLVMEDTGLVELPDTIEGLRVLRYLSLVNCTSVKSLPDAVGELKMLTELDLSGTTVVKLPRSICNRLRLKLRINSSEISKKLMGWFPRLEGIKNYCNNPFYRAWLWLVSSYEALEYGAKQIFLDIACFFVCKKITSAKFVWEACDFLPEVELDSLVREGFIDVSNTSDRVRMSGEVRKFAREIFHREITRQPQDRSRSWSPEMALDLEGIKIVRALAFGILRDDYELKHEDYAYLRNMRILELDGHTFAGDFKIELPELRWLCWRNCPPKLQPNNFVLSNIVVLKLSGDITIEEWNRWVEVMVAGKLKVLNLGGSKSFIKTPCFSEFMSLERLILKDFPSLVEIDRSISKLERLIYLKIKCCPLLRELPQEMGGLTALRELILIQCFSVCYLPDSIGNLSLLSRLVMEDTGLVELPDTIRGLGDLEHLSLANCRSLNSLSDAVGELKSFTELDLSGTIIAELPPPLWDIQDLTLNIHGSRIKTRVDRYNSLLPEIELYLRSPVAEFFLPIRDYPMEIFTQKWRPIVAPGFHEHHLSARCPPKILARVIFPLGGDDLSVDIAAEVPVSNTGIMSSSKPLRSFRNVIIMLVSWLERKPVSKWMHDFQRKDEALLSLEFCDHCMCITSEIRELSPSPPCLESFDRFPQLSVDVSMTLREPGHSDQTGCRVDNLEISTKFSAPTCCSTNLLLKGPLSIEKLEKCIDSWHEEPAQLGGLKSRISFKSSRSRPLRKSRGGRLRAKRKRNMTWLCLHNHLDKRLLLSMALACLGYCILSPFTQTKLDFCNYVLEEGCTLLQSAFDVKHINHLAGEFIRDVKLFSRIFAIVRTVGEDYSEYTKRMYILLLRWYFRNRRRGHHHKTLDASFLTWTNYVEHFFHDKDARGDKARITFIR